MFLSAQQSLPYFKLRSLGSPKSLWQGSAASMRTRLSPGVHFLLAIESFNTLSTVQRVSWCQPLVCAKLYSLQALSSSKHIDPVWSSYASQTKCAAFWVPGLEMRGIHRAFVMNLPLCISGRALGGKIDNIDDLPEVPAQPVAEERLTISSNMCFGAGGDGEQENN